MNEQKTELDQIFVLDTISVRGEETTHFLRNRAKSVDFLGEDEKAIDEFRKRVDELLEQKKSVMVVFNYLVEVRRDVIKILREVESVRKVETRRILLSCYSHRKVKNGFRDRGIEYEGIRHISYSQASTHFGNTHFEKLNDLFVPKRVIQKPEEVIN